MSIRRVLPLGRVGESEPKMRDIVGLTTGNQGAPPWAVKIHDGYRTVVIIAIGKFCKDLRRGKFRFLDFRFIANRSFGNDEIGTVSSFGAYHSRCAASGCFASSVDCYDNAMLAAA